MTVSLASHGMSLGQHDLEASLMLKHAKTRNQCVQLVLCRPRLYLFIHQFGKTEPFLAPCALVRCLTIIPWCLYHAGSGLPGSLSADFWASISGPPHPASLTWLSPRREIEKGALRGVDLPFCTSPVACEPCSVERPPSPACLDGPRARPGLRRLPAGLINKVGTERC